MLCLVLLLLRGDGVCFGELQGRGLRGPRERGWRGERALRTRLKRQGVMPPCGFVGIGACRHRRGRCLRSRSRGSRTRASQLLSGCVLCNIRYNRQLVFDFVSFSFCGGKDFGGSTGGIGSTPAGPEGRAVDGP